MRFETRDKAGRELAQHLAQYRGTQTIICGIPPGGAVVGAAAAIELGVAYECMVLCRIAMPCFPDVVLGTIDADGNAMFDPKSQLTRHEMAKVGGSLRDRLAQKVLQCRGDRPEPDFEGRTVIVVDEAVPEPLVALGAEQFLRAKGVERLVLAAPAISREAREKLEDRFDEVVAIRNLGRAETPESIYAEEPPSDVAVSRHLKAAWEAAGSP